MNEKQKLTEAVRAFTERSEARPETFGPAPNRQTSQFPDSDQWEEALFAYVNTFEGVTVGNSHISGDGGYRAFFLPKYDNLRGLQEQFLVDNEFAHIHSHNSRCMHAVLPPEIGALVESKKWGEKHPLAKMGIAGSTNHLLYGARDQRETEQLKALFRISYLFANQQW